MTHTHQVFDNNRLPKILGNKLAEGGEGVIYPLADRQDVLIKLYHPQELAKRGLLLQQKVTAMRSIPALAEHKGVSWPRLHVFDKDQRWIGYAMYRAEGKTLFMLAHAMLYKKHFPNLDRRQLVSYLINLVSHLKDLQAHGIMVGDYSPHNMLCNPNSNAVTLIDCDSYQLQHNGRHFANPVGTPDMTPLEHHGASFSSLVRTPESEAFSLAIILFKCLMLGRHPYDIVGGEDPVTNLKRGNFAYGIGNKGIPAGPWYNIWSHMPHRLKSHFITTFTDGAQNPAQRTSLDEWLETLRLYLSEMDKGWHETAMSPAQPKSSTYRGSQSSSGA